MVYSCLCRFLGALKMLLNHQYLPSPTASLNLVYSKKWRETKCNRLKPTLHGHSISPSLTRDQTDQKWTAIYPYGHPDFSGCASIYIKFFKQDARRLHPELTGCRQIYILFWSDSPGDQSKIPCWEKVKAVHVEAALYVKMCANILQE